MGETLQNESYPEMPPARAFRIHPEDNVATLLEDASTGPVEVLGEGPCRLEAAEPIRASHKIALVPIPADGSVRKYGLPIGRATCQIPAGAWVHLHNLSSSYDTRSASLDVDSGVPTDIDEAYD